MTLSKFIYYCVLLAFFSIIATTVVADMMKNDSQYLIGRTNVERVVQRSGCCDGGFWQLLALEDEYSGLSAQNYKFPLLDENFLYLIIEGYGPHSYYYMGFIDGPELQKPIALSFEIPSFEFARETFSVDRERPIEELIINPSFDPVTSKLFSWDLMGVGEASYSVTYQYNSDEVRFDILEFNKEMTTPDGVNVELKFSVDLTEK